MDNPVKKQVLKNSFFNFFANILIRLGGIIFTAIIARFLLPEKFGIYSLALSIVLIFLTLTDMGINQTLLRYLAFSFPKNKKRAFRRKVSCFDS